MLHAADIVQSQQHPLQHLSVVIPDRILVTVGRRHRCDTVNGEFRLYNSVFVRKAAISRTLFIQHLNLQGLRDPVLTVPENLLIMSFHNLSFLLFPSAFQHQCLYLKRPEPQRYLTFPNR